MRGPLRSVLSDGLSPHRPDLLLASPSMLASKIAAGSGPQAAYHASSSASSELEDGVPAAEREAPARQPRRCRDSPQCSGAPLDCARHSVPRVHGFIHFDGRSAGGFPNTGRVGPFWLLHRGRQTRWDNFPIQTPFSFQTPQDGKVTRPGAAATHVQEMDLYERFC